VALWRDSDISETLVGQGIRMRAPVVARYEEWAKLRGASRTHTEPWEPSWAKDELTHDAFKRRIDRYQNDRETGASYPFFIFRAQDNVLIGACNLNNIRRGVLQSCDIGYWIGAPYVRQGHARAAIRRILAFAFDELQLHRVEAAIQPENTASRSLLEGIGFNLEGRSRAFLNIAGQWRDHDRFALISDDSRK
jgi:ribosomal-protein-alanine N-acetyltransferase